MNILPHATEVFMYFSLSIEGCLISISHQKKERCFERSFQVLEINL